VRLLRVNVLLRRTADPRLVRQVGAVETAIGRKQWLSAIRRRGKGRAFRPGKFWKAEAGLRCDGGRLSHRGRYLYPPSSPRSRPVFAALMEKLPPVDVGKFPPTSAFMSLPAPRSVVCCVRGERWGSFRPLPLKHFTPISSWLPQG